MKKSFLFVTTGIVTILPVQKSGAQEKPNIIYILADQLRYDVLGYNGDTIAVTN